MVDYGLSESFLKDIEEGLSKNGPRGTIILSDYRQQEIIDKITYYLEDIGCAVRDIVQDGEEVHLHYDRGSH